MTFTGIAILFAKLAVMSGGVSALVVGSEKFNMFKYQPKKKEKGGKEDANARIESLREKIQH